jgi:hypothetical protein
VEESLEIQAVKHPNNRAYPRLWKMMFLGDFFSKRSSWIIFITKAITKNIVVRHGPKEKEAEGRVPPTASVRDGRELGVLQTLQSQTNYDNRTYP